MMSPLCLQGGLNGFGDSCASRGRGDLASVARWTRGVENLTSVLQTEKCKYSISHSCMQGGTPVSKGKGRQSLLSEDQDPSPAQRR